MDLSVYIAELLNENGKVSIPHIGIFSHVRMRGYYKADEGKLYPPYYQTAFDHSPDTDDSLLRYIIGKTNVSEQSARYFMDRYLQNILQQAEIGEAMLGRIGWIAKDGDTLQFRPAPNISTATAAFGFSPVDLRAQLALPEHEATATMPEPPAATPSTIVDVPEKVATEEAPSEQPIVEPAPVDTTKYHIEKELNIEQPATAPTGDKPAVPLSPLLRQPSKPDGPQTPPATPQPVAPAPIVEATPAAPVEAPEYVKPFYAKTWFMALVAGAIIIAGIIIFYPSADSAYSTKKNEKDAVVPSTDPVKIKVAPVPPDTVMIKPAVAAIDTTVTNRPLPASTEFAPEIETPAKGGKGTEITNTNNYKFVLIGGSYGTRALAQAAADRYHTAGINASAFINTGRTVKVALGFFETYAEGQDAKKELVRQQKVLSWKLYVEMIRKNLKK